MVISLVIYLFLSFGEKFWQWHEDQKAPEEFYEQEITKIYLKEKCLSEMNFFTDAAGNKSVALMLEDEPIPKSLHLWEGGYHAPPITFAVSGTEVIFQFSGFMNGQEYQGKGPLYQIRYFPKKQ